MLAGRLNHTLDRLARPTIRIGGRTLPSFQLCGYAGLVLAVLLTQALALASGRSSWVMVAVTLAAAATFLALAMLTKIVLGQERLVSYHHEIAVLLVAAVLIRLLGQPVLAYLDLTVLGVGAFLVCGRIGCLLASCCHGRPSRWGVRYGHEHARLGLDGPLVGARLFPTQPVESGLVLGVVAVGSVMVLRGLPAGSALAWYVVVYGLGRFGLEFVRGDVGRPYHGGFSQAQWISLGLTVAVAGAELAGWLPLRTWQLLAATGLALAMAGIAVGRRRAARGSLPRHRLVDARHLLELAGTLDRLGRAVGTPEIQVAETAAGLRVSRGRLPAGLHYTVSCEQGIDRQGAKTLASLIVQLEHPDHAYELRQGGAGSYHVLIGPSPSPVTGRAPASGLH